MPPAPTLPAPILASRTKEPPLRRERSAPGTWRAQRRGAMHVRFFGTRGSIATPGPHTLHYGGNTSCVEVRSNSGTLIVLDMGTGAAVLGRDLMARGEPLRGH